MVHNGWLHDGPTVWEETVHIPVSSVGSQRKAILAAKYTKNDIIKKTRRQLNGLDKLGLNSFEEEIVKHLKRGDKLSGKDGILIPLITRVIESSLERELTAHLEEEKAPGPKRVLIACIDNLTGFAQAIENTFPDTVHQFKIRRIEDF